MPTAKIVLKSIAFELRYDHAFRLWDRAGSLWTEVANAHWGQLEPDEAQPNITSFWLDRPRYQLRAEIQKLLVISYRPEDGPTPFEELAHNFSKIVKDRFELEAYTRVGCRLVYIREFEDMAKASKAVVALQPLTLSVPGISDGKTVGDPAFSLRWEDEDTGVRLHIAAQQESKRLNPPAEFADMEPVERTSQQMVFDFDHYTRKPTPSSMLNVQEWIRERIAETRRGLDDLISRSK